MCRRSKIEHNRHQLPPLSRLPRSLEGETPADTLPGLPDHLALQCLATVPATFLWGVCKKWQKLLYECDDFQSLRLECGLHALQWIYCLVRLNDGDYKWYAYDPLARVWHSLPAIPDKVDFQLTNAGFLGLSHSVQCATTSTKLIMVAGLQLKKNNRPRPHLEPALDCPLIFDTMKREWTKGLPFPVPRKWCACGTAGDKLLVASGSGREWQLGLSKSVEMYDIDKKIWSVVDNLKTSKFSGEAISAVNVGGNLHMVSGKGVFWKVGAILNVSTGKWEEMPAGMRKGWTGSCVVVDGRMFVLDDCPNVGRLKVYDEREDAWKVYMEDELLKGMKELVGAPGNICGIVAGEAHHTAGPVIRIVDICLGTMGVRSVDVQPPRGEVIAIRVLSRMKLEESCGREEMQCDGEVCMKSLR